jgi:hypothetical protein
MKHTIILFSLLLTAGCNLEKTTSKSTNDRGQNQYMVRYNVSGVPEIFTTDKVIWSGTTGAIKFVDQNGVPRTVSGTFEIIHLSDIYNHER